MGLASESLQLSSTTLREHCWQKRDFTRKSRLKANNGGIENRLLGKLSFPASSSAPLCNPGYPKIVFAEGRSESNLVASSDGALSVDPVTEIELTELDQCIGSNPLNPSSSVSPSDRATELHDGVLGKSGTSKASVLPEPSNSSFGSSEYVQYTEEPACSSNGATDDVLSSARLHHNADAGDADGKDLVSTSTTPANPDVEEKGKIRRFSLNEPVLLKAKPLTPLEKSKLELIMKFKLTNDNLKGKLVIRAARTEQLKDLEELLTDSYSELMWGPLAYRPALAWVLRTYLREREAYLPHAVTLVGLYSPSEETNIDQGLGSKWWLAGAVEVSFDASGKPKDMQTPPPPKEAPFLSNMAVLKKFRRRGIGRELLKAAEELTMQMGGNEMYLHCRMVDEVPLNMYTSSGYTVVETDSLVSLFLFQRRRHLMYKRLEACVCEE